MSKIVNATLQNAAAAVGTGTPIDVKGMASLTLQVSGAFVGTVTFEGTQDDQNWIGLLGQNYNTGSQVTETTAPGLFAFAVAGLSKVRARISAYTSGAITVKGTALPIALAGLSSATINATVDAVKIKDVTGTNTLGVEADGSALMKLTSSSVIDSQLNPKFVSTSLAYKDIAMRATEGIVDILGLENISMFLPGWESTGTVCKDLIRPRDVQFNIAGATLAQDGLLHPVPSFDGVNDYLVEKPVITSMNSNSVLAIDSPTKMLAQKVIATTNAFIPGFVRLNLAKVESLAGNLNSATIQLELRSDNSGIPGSTAFISTPAFNVSALFTTAYWFGLYLNIPTLSLTRGIPYWFVLKYVNSTGVDASNYVTVGLDTGGGYGNPYATYDGAAWTAVAGQNISFEIYNDAMNFLNTATNGYSVIFPFYKAELNPGTQVLLSLGRHGITDSGDMPAAAKLEIGGSFNDSRLTLSWDDYYSTKTHAPYYAGIGGGWNVWAMTNDFAGSTGKIKIYWNGVPVKSIDGTAGAKPGRETFPSTVATVMHISGSVSLSLYANMKCGPIIATNNIITQAQLGKVINQLLALRRLKEAV